MAASQSHSQADRCFHALVCLLDGDFSHHPLFAGVSLSLSFLTTRIGVLHSSPNASCKQGMTHIHPRVSHCLCNQPDLYSTLCQQAKQRCCSHLSKLKVCHSTALHYLCTVCSQPAVSTLLVGPLACASHPSSSSALAQVASSGYPAAADAVSAARPPRCCRRVHLCLLRPPVPGCSACVHASATC